MSCVKLYLYTQSLEVFMIIKNTKQLSKNNLRSDALKIVEAGYEAIKIDNIYKNNISYENHTLEIQNKTYDLNKYNNVYVVGVGKGSDHAAKAIEDLSLIHI